MQKYIFSALILLFGCSDGKQEGETEGDCRDGEDNDDDGFTDCYDDSCDGKPACMNFSDSGSWSNDNYEYNWDYGSSECYSGGRSCWLEDGEICIDYSSSPQSWCSSIGGYYENLSCPSSANAICDIPAGGSADYEQCATAYYYEYSDPAGACSSIGGTLR